MHTSTLFPYLFSYNIFTAIEWQFLNIFDFTLIGACSDTLSFLCQSYSHSSATCANLKAKHKSFKTTLHTAYTHMCIYLYGMRYLSYCWQPSLPVGEGCGGNFAFYLLASARILTSEFGKSVIACLLSHFCCSHTHTLTHINIRTHIHMFVSVSKLFEFIRKKVKFFKANCTSLDQHGFYVCCSCYCGSDIIAYL